MKKTNIITVRGKKFESSIEDLENLGELGHGYVCDHVCGYGNWHFIYIKNSLEGHVALSLRCGSRKLEMSSLSKYATQMCCKLDYCIDFDCLFFAGIDHAEIRESGRE